MILYDDTEPYRTIAATMSRFTFTKPVTDEDLAVVQSEVETAAPGTSARVKRAWPGADAVQVEVMDGTGLPAFTRLYFAT